MKFWILATLMLKGSHVTILVKFDQILSQILVKLGQILVKFFKISKQAFLDPKYVAFWVFQSFDQSLAKSDQILTQNMVKIDQNGHVRSF